MSKSAPACCCCPRHSTMICKSVGRAHLSTQTSRNSSFRIGKECPSGGACKDKMGMNLSSCAKQVMGTP
eukprot:scaffold33310_cov29-Attheya_sp.AAC.1